MKIYQNISKTNNKKIKILGLTCYQKVKTAGFISKYYLLGLYKIKFNKFIKKHYLFGIQVRVERLIDPKIQYLTDTIVNRTVRKMFNINKRLITASVLHSKAFAPFKGAFRGKSIVLVGAGPSLKDFKKIPDAIYVGCNRVFLKDDIDFDFLFSIDKAGIDKWYEQFFSYKPEECIKFIGDQNLGEKFQIPENKIPLKNVYRYITDAGLCVPNDFDLDIASVPLKNAATITVQAMQFILYTQPARIYIVGVDCTVSQKKYFVGEAFDSASRNEDPAHLDNVNIRCWKQIKTFADTYYPDTQIISVNPVRLEGLFTDIYTKGDTYVTQDGEIFDVDLENKNSICCG